MAKPGSYAEFKKESRRLWKTEIIKAAAAAFKKKGYHGTTMDDIARKLKITKGSLYYYFKNKEAVLFGCHMASLDIADMAIEHAMNSNFTPSEKLHAFVFRYIVEMMDELLASVLLLEEEALSPNLLKEVIERRDQIERFLRETLTEGMKTGEFRKGNPKLIAFAILGAINWIPKWCDPAGEKRPPEIAHEFAVYLLSGLRQDGKVFRGRVPK